jgi:hypothetical protein
LVLPASGSKPVARKQGKKPATFNFLGFVHICARSRQGRFTVHVKTIAKAPMSVGTIEAFNRRSRHQKVFQDSLVDHGYAVGLYPFVVVGIVAHQFGTRELLQGRVKVD